MDKVKIAVGDIVYYRSKAGNQVVCKVRKVNRVNSKVEMLAVGDRVVLRYDTVVIPKINLRRATPSMIELVYDCHLDPAMF